MKKKKTLSIHSRIQSIQQNQKLKKCSHHSVIVELDQIYDSKIQKMK